MRVLGIALAIALWEVLARMVGSPAFTPPSQVAPALLDASLLPDALSSLKVVLAGFVAAVVLGVGAGVLASQSSLVKHTIVPVADALRNVSALAIFPVTILLLGLGIVSKSSIILWAAWPSIFLSTLHGMSSVDKDVREAAELDGSSKLSLVQHVLLPLSMGSILTGVRIGMGTGWIAVVAAEMLGASKGLGFAVLAATQTFHFPAMYAAIVAIAAIGLAMNTVLAGLQAMVERSMYESPDVAARASSDSRILYFNGGDGIYANDPLHRLQGLRSGLPGSGPGPVHEARGERS